MKFKILGTSNGFVTGGYGDHLKHDPKVDLVQNLSIGSSHPTVIMNGLGRNNPDLKASHIILDVCVNEQRALMRGLFDGSISEILFDYFLAHCKKYKMIPIVLLLPVMNSEGVLLQTTLEKWKKFCIDRNVEFIDVSELSIEHGSPKELWRDRNHPSIEFSKIIADEIKSKANSLIPYEFKTNTSVKNFQTIPIPHGTSLRRETRLFSADLKKLNENDSFTINSENGREFRVLGFSLDMAHTHAAVELVGKNKITQRLDNSFYDEERSLWFVSWSLVKPVYSENGKVTIKIVMPENSKQQLMNDHTKTEPEQINVTAELETILICYL